MFDIITDKKKDPLGAMMLDYLVGNHDVFIEVESPNMEMWKMEGATMFRNHDKMSDLEKKALELCRGKILDVGAGSGCHTLYLEQQGHKVDAIDISPGAVRVMKERGVQSVSHQNIFALQEVQYTTILMLMNGIGICGSLDGCNLFLQFAKTILEQGGQIIVDSTDVEVEDDPGDFTDEGYYGETEFIMKYGDNCSEPFNWVFVDYETLTGLAGFNGFNCEKIATDEEGRYLARIF